MANQRRRHEPPAEVPVLGAPIDDDDAEDVGGSEDDIDLLVSELAGEAEYVVLWRLDGTSAKQEHVDRVPLGRFNAQYVLEKHGGGDYLFRAYGPKVAGGGRKFKRYKEFSINKAVPPKTGSAALAWNTAHPANTPATAAAGPAPGMPDWIKTILIATVPAVASALVARLGAKREADPLLLELIRNRGNGGTDPVELQKLLADERDRAIKLGRELAGGGGGDDEDGGTTKLIGKGLDVLGEVVTQWKSNATGADSATPRLLASDGRGTAGVAGDSTTGISESALPSSTEAGTVRPWVQAASGFAGVLSMTAGRVGADTAARIIGDTLDDPAWDDLLADIEDDAAPGFVARVRTYFPGFENVRPEWLQEVAGFVLQMAEGDEDEPTAETKDHGPKETEGASGNRTPDDSRAS